MSKFGELTVPFGRCHKPLPPHKKLQPCHCVRKDFENFIHNAKSNGLPEDPAKIGRLNKEQIEELKKYRTLTSDQSKKRELCYLWVINEDEVIEILGEKTVNLKDEATGFVKHTNITGGKKAYHGGEMFFDSENTIYINNKSDRYGDAGEYWCVVAKHFRIIYSKYKVIDLLNNEV